jgi:hypothetical protein
MLVWKENTHYLAIILFERGKQEKKLTEDANLRAHILMLLLQVKPSTCKSPCLMKIYAVSHYSVDNNL